jgi:hypothetical protein
MHALTNKTVKNQTDHVSQVNFSSQNKGPVVENLGQMHDATQ